MPHVAIPFDKPRPDTLLLIRLVRLVEQEVSRKLLVLVACEVGLRSHVAVKAETAQL